MIFVIGSGPAGVASTVALVEKGHQVTMLDAGMELERDRAQIIQQLEDQDSANWDGDALARLRENMRSSVSGMFRKHTYGSDFPYRETETYIPREAENVAIVPSLAKGGFSNVWGAAVLPYLADDMSDWPISLNELAPHYRSILAFMDLAATRDDLASRFPLYSDSYQPLRHSHQVEEFLDDLRRNREPLQARGFLFGY